MHGRLRRMSLTLVEDGDRASVRRCADCGAVMDAWCHTPNGDLCPADARGWILARRYQRLRALPMLWHLRDAIRAAKDSALAAEVRNEDLLLVAQLGKSLGAKVQHVTVLPDGDGTLAYWLWWPDAGVHSGTQLLQPLGDSTTDPVEAAISVAAQIVMDTPH